MLLVPSLLLLPVQTSSYGPAFLGKVIHRGKIFSTLNPNPVEKLESIEVLARSENPFSRSTSSNLQAKRPKNPDMNEDGLQMNNGGSPARHSLLAEWQNGSAVQKCGIQSCTLECLHAELISFSHTLRGNLVGGLPKFALQLRFGQNLEIGIVNILFISCFQQIKINYFR